MTTPEYQPELPQVGFLDMTYQLAESDSLILSRNRVRHIRGGDEIDQAPVHYEGLNYLSDIYRPINPGKIVTDEFRKAAMEVVNGGDNTVGAMYPFLTVINHTTGTRITEKVHIAELIKNDTLPLYSIPARSTKKGEMVSIGFTTLIRELAQRVGVNPVGAVVVEDGGAHTIEETGLLSRTHLMVHADATTVATDQTVGGAAAFEPRGSAAISLLQMDAAQAFISNRHRVTEGADGRVEVVVRVAAQPDLQTLMLSLIDLVELNHMHLAYTNDEIATGEIGSVFSVVDSDFNTLFALSGERTLDMATYNAYLAAMAILPEL